MAMPWDIAVRDGLVYVTVRGEQAGQGAIVRFPVEGGPLETLAAGLDAPDRIFVSPDHVYWTLTDIDGGVYRTPLDGDGGVEVVAAHQYRPIGVLADATHVYWAAGDSVYKQPLGATSGAAIISPTLDTPSFLAHDGQHLFVTLNGKAGGLYRLELDGSDAGPLGDQKPSSNGLTLCGNTLFFATLLIPGAVYAVTTEGHGLKELAAEQATPTEIACDEQHVYWATLDDGTVWWKYPSGGQPQILVDKQIAPQGVTVDADYVYWTVYTPTGSVRRTRKPQ
jgi:sugar lactone lactonase YvrE